MCAFCDVHLNYYLTAYGLTLSANHCLRSGSESSYKNMLTSNLNKQTGSSSQLQTSLEILKYVFGINRYMK